MAKAIVLQSGGQDSTTCLFLARVMFDEAHAVSIVYGQRHVAEIAAARQVASLAGASHEVLDVPVLGLLGGSDLVRKSTHIAAGGGHVDATMPQGLPTSFVPGRNALFLDLAAIVAVREGARDIIIGASQTDYSGYPDCRREFMDAKERSLTLAMPSSCGPFRIHTPLMHLTKAETVQLARRLPGCWDALALTVTCYNGFRPGCGTCPACVLRAAGFAAAGEVDPAEVTR